MNRRELLNLKRRAIALSLASACTLGLAGCSGNIDNASNLSDEMAILNDDAERKQQFLCIYEDKALIIEPREGSYGLGEGCYEINLNDSIFNSMSIPMSQFICFEKVSPITAEDYVALVCGPDFPIEYIRSEDYIKSR